MIHQRLFAQRLPVIGRIHRIQIGLNLRILQRRQHVFRQRGLIVNDFLRSYFYQFADQRVQIMAIFQMHAGQLSGSNIPVRNAHLCLRGEHRCDKNIFVILGGTGDVYGSRRNDSNHLPANQALCLRRILHLFANGHLVTALHQLGNVGIRRMEPEPRTWVPVQTAGPAGKGQFSSPGRRFWHHRKTARRSPPAETKIRQSGFSSLICRYCCIIGDNAIIISFFIPFYSLFQSVQIRISFLNHVRNPARPFFKNGFFAVIRKFTFCLAGKKQIFDISFRPLYR